MNKKTTNNKKKNDEIREEINEQLSEFNSFLEMWAFGFTDPDDGFPLNFENILKTLNDVEEIIDEALEVYNKLNRLLEKELTYDEVWDELVKKAYFTEEELALITKLFGCDIKTLNDAIYLRYGFTDYKLLLF
jgi:hypothetical protein